MMLMSGGGGRKKIITSGILVMLPNLRQMFRLCDSLTVTIWVHLEMIFADRKGHSGVQILVAFRRGR